MQEIYDVADLEIFIIESWEQIHLYFGTPTVVSMKGFLERHIPIAQKLHLGGTSQECFDLVLELEANYLKEVLSAITPYLLNSRRLTYSPWNDLHIFNRVYDAYQDEIKKRLKLDSYNEAVPEKQAVKLLK